MDWNFKMDEAPKKGLIISATKCDKVIVTKWLDEEGRWNMYTKDSGPVAWQIYPAHPNAKKEDETAVEDMF